MAKSNENILSVVNLIAGSTTLTGNVVTESDIRIDGILNGNLITKGRLLVGVDGKITGDISCRNADIEGLLRGKIEVEALLVLKSSANFEGEIITSQIQIDAGAIFSGTCKMNRQGGDKSK